jgi:hypothetical protein
MRISALQLLDCLYVTTLSVYLRHNSFDAIFFTVNVYTFESNIELNMFSEVSDVRSGALNSVYTGDVINAMQ